MRLTFLGTGNAMATSCYNTCFILESDGQRLLVDAGGGNGVLVQLEKLGLTVADIHDLYITHAHSDHVMGCLWVVRLYVQLTMAGRATGPLRGWPLGSACATWCYTHRGPHPRHAARGIHRRGPVGFHRASVRARRPRDHHAVTQGGGEGTGA